MEKVACNYCKSAEADFIEFFRDLAFDLPGEFPYVRCRNCGLIYLQTRPSPEEIHLYYPAQYQPYRTAIQDEASPLMRRARQRNILRYCRTIARVTPRQSGRILDIGCSTGIFLDAMRQQGWETQGVEISAQAGAYARERFGLQVFEGQLHEASFEGETFDAITLWNVFEHLYQPFETLQEVYRLLRKGGVLAMTFPNWESWDHRWFGKAWIGFDAPRHLFVFPRPVHQHLLATTGLRCEKIGMGLQNYYTFLASLKRWLKLHLRSSSLQDSIWRLMNLPGIRFVFQPFFSVTDALNKGGTTLIVARKP